MTVRTFYNDSEHLEAIEDALRKAGIEEPTVLASVESIIPSSGQIDKLAAFIIDEVPGEPSQGQGAVDTAIRVIRELQAAKVEYEKLADDWVTLAAGHPVPLTDGVVDGDDVVDPDAHAPGGYV